VQSKAVLTAGSRFRGFQGSYWSSACLFLERSGKVSPRLVVDSAVGVVRRYRIRRSEARGIPRGRWCVLARLRICFLVRRWERCRCRFHRLSNALVRCRVCKTRRLEIWVWSVFWTACREWTLFFLTCNRHSEACMFWRAVHLGVTRHGRGFVRGIEV
jgi:hypothetical protein